MSGGEVFQPTKVNFYLPDNPETGFLSNSYPSGFDLFDRAWLTVEQCIRAQNITANEPSALIECMRLCIAAKFLQNQALRLSLLNEKYDRAIFVNVDPTDSFWGAGSAGYGGNELGKLLTVFRQELCGNRSTEFSQIERLAVNSVMYGDGRFFFSGDQYAVANGGRNAVPADGEYVMDFLLMTLKVVYRIKNAVRD